MAAEGRAPGGIELPEWAEKALQRLKPLLRFGRVETEYIHGKVRRVTFTISFAEQDVIEMKL